MSEPVQDERTALYRLYDAEGQLLYIGISATPEKRCQQHATEKPWWSQVARREIKWFDDRSAAAAAEVAAIVSESPRHNGTRTLEKRRHYQLIADALRAEISDGTLTPGFKIPSEWKLADRFATTRATVRKGVALLRAEGLVVSHQGKGAFVRDPISRTAPIPVTDPKAAAEALADHMSREDLVALTQALIAEIAKT